MVNEDILGGIETAFAKGETFESAMMSFYNSGYSKEDIEWAAKAFQMNQFRAGPEKRIQIRPTGAVPVEPKKEVIQNQFMKKPYVKQNVSNYEQASQFQERIILIVLVSAFILLLGILAGVFVFKERLVSFINSLFSG
jgi:hypothetical protein